MSATQTAHCRQCGTSADVHHIAYKGEKHQFECPDCGSTKTHMADYNPDWHDGNIYCLRCGRFIRYYDAG